MQKVKKVMLPRAKVVQNDPNGLTFFEFWKSIKVKRFLFSIEVLLHSVSSKKAQHWFEPSFFASKCYFLTVTHQKTMKLDPKSHFQLNWWSMLQSHAHRYWLYSTVLSQLLKALCGRGFAIWTTNAVEMILKLDPKNNFQLHWWSKLQSHAHRVLLEAG